MNRALLNKAVDSLAIQGVFLRSAEVKCKEGIDLPFIESELSLTPQHRGAPIGQTKVLVVSSPSGVETRTVVFYFSAGSRLVESSTFSTVNSEDVGPESVYVEMTAEFGAQYSLRHQLDEAEFDAAMEEFGRFNVAFHVWPYWREYVQSTCCRMGIPPIPVPFFLVPSSEQAVDESPK
jgi:hypothetical protein